MHKKAIYSIGHGTRQAAELLSLLEKFGIAYLIDVRSVPYSRYNPQFNQPALQAYLVQNGIRYVFMGDALGGRPKDSLCYNLDGKVNYNIVKTKGFFLQGIARLKTAYDKGIAVAVMCSEHKPEHCHRSRLIGSTLFEQGITLLHIDEHGELKTHENLMELL